MAETPPKSLPRYSERQRDTLENDLAYHELALREGNGLQVILYWLKKTNALSIVLTNLDKNTQARFDVPNDQGLEAFYHPYAYLGDTKERRIRNG